MENVQCSVCGKQIQGYMISKTEYDDPANSGLIFSSLAYKCQHCGVVYCVDEVFKLRKTKFFKGIHDSTCPECGQMFGPGFTITSKPSARQKQPEKATKQDLPVSENKVNTMKALPPEKPPTGYQYCPKCSFPNPEKEMICRSCGLDVRFLERSLSETAHPKERAIALALLKTPIYETKGHLSGKVLLTPSEVKYFPSLFFSLPRYEYKTRYDLNSKDFKSPYSFDWQRSGKNYLVGIHAWTGLPDCCCVCLKQPSRYEMYSANYTVATIKFTLPPGEANAETADRVAEAWAEMRNWIPVPFCEEHSMKQNKPIEISIDDGLYTFRFKNKEYSDLFAETHQLKAKYIDLRQSLKNLCLYLLLITSIGLLANGLFVNYMGLTDPNGQAAHYGFWSTQAGFLICGLLLGLIWFFLNRANEKENK
jgi:hypothetical protein